MLAYEKEVLGFYVTSNPLSQHAEAINNYSTTNTAHLAQSNGQGNGDKQVIVGGMITKIRYNLTKNGRNAGSKMAVFNLEDLQGQIEVVLFPDTLNEFASLLVEDSVVFVRGKADYRRERANIIASELIPLEQGQGEARQGRADQAGRQLGDERDGAANPQHLPVSQGGSPVPDRDQDGQGQDLCDGGQGPVDQSGHRILPQDETDRRR